MEKELLELLRDKQPEVFPNSKLDQNDSSFPTKHPRLTEISFYPESSPLRVERTESTNLRDDINISQLFSERKGKTARFVAILGEAGAGKSTMSARLCESADKYTLHLRCTQMNYGSLELKMKEILLQHNYNLGESKANEYFAWMDANQQRCRIVLDGYDQAIWKNCQLPPKLSHEAEGKVEDVIGNLLQGHLLPNVQLVVTSRPHAMMSLPVELRPDRVVMLNGFSQQDAKELFVYFVGIDGEQKWCALEALSPNLCLMCSNPAMLTYTACLLCARDEVPLLQTITSVVRVLLQSFTKSSTEIEDLQAMKLTKKN